MPSMIGKIVLFKIASDPEVIRPLLVVSDKDGALSGELFLDWEADQRVEWVTQNLFYMPQKHTRTVPVEDVKEGDALGQWRKK